MAKKKSTRRSTAKRSSTTSAQKSVESIRHKDTRKNIPTEELRDFVTEDEHAPQTMLYPRDPSLDPQLVWKGKDEQDQADLAVPVVPIYIQEKIHPQAIIDSLPRKEVAGDQQLDLFADFNGLEGDFDRKVEFYQHDQHWSNRMILGDSLLVMTSLAEKEGLKGKVQTIYFDPPYGIKFGSNWQVSTRKRDVKDGKAEDTTRQPEQVRAFRDTWKLGIHSYLAYLRDRLVAARELLTDSGSVFVQIGDDNVHLVRSVLDEVFGSENFCSLISFRTTSSLGGDLLGKSCDYLLWYAKDRELARAKFRQLYKPRGYEDDIGGRYTRAQLPDGTRRVMSAEEKADIGQLPKGSRIYRHDNLTSQSGTEKSAFPITFDGHRYTPGKGFWKTNEKGMAVLRNANRLAAPTPNSLGYVRFIDDFPVGVFSNVWTDTQTGAFTDDKVYVVQTNTKVIERCLLMTTDPGDLVLDPTCGSGTTACVAEQWGRRWITCDTSRVSLALARTRLMAAKFPYYYLAENHPQISQLSADDDIKTYLRKTAPSADNPSADIRKGFIYKRVPHVTLKSIANNPDIKEGLSRDEIDAAIARHAETETLFDQPYEDNKRVRVSGPFTVESLSPHRTISVEDKKRLAEVGVPSGVTVKVVGPSDFANMILENLRKAGVQNTRKGERLKFDTLTPYASEWIHGEGRYTETDGTEKRAAICIGPEHGTVGAQLVKEAAKEAVKGVGFDLLIVCGFAFDPSVSEEAKRYGKLTVLAARMNPDLAMGDELLKKTGAGNLFMVFGEPDLEIKKQQDGQLVAEIKGLDVYDPTTGEIRSSSTDDVACWFIDTEYNGESFFVRHAYFTGAASAKDGGPYDKLKRALRAEIDEAAWSSLYSTTSRPFPRPQTGKIAVKVINHYGDEVLKVYEV
jgi:adenine-specific DNA-methyltransferase